MSTKYQIVKGYYRRGLWDAQRVRNAVGRWITAQEAEEILGGAD